MKTQNRILLAIVLLVFAVAFLTGCPVGDADGAGAGDLLLVAMPSGMPCVVNFPGGGVSCDWGWRGR